MTLIEQAKLKKIEHKLAGMGLAALLTAPAIVSADNVAFSSGNIALAGGLAQVAGSVESNFGEEGASFQ